MQKGMQYGLPAPRSGVGSPEPCHFSQVQNVDSEKYNHKDDGADRRRRYGRLDRPCIAYPCPTLLYPTALLYRRVFAFEFALFSGCQKSSFDGKKRFRALASDTTPFSLILGLMTLHVICYFTRTYLIFWLK